MFATVERLCIALLAGVVIQTDDYSIGNGVLIDWFTVKSGYTIMQGDPFDLAHLLVYLESPEEINAALAKEGF